MSELAVGKRKRDEEGDSVRSVEHRPECQDVGVSIMQVPVEILQNVAKYLTVADLKEFRSCCRHFYHSCKTIMFDEQVLHKFCEWTRFLRTGTDEKHQLLRKIVETLADDDDDEQQPSLDFLTRLSRACVSVHYSSFIDLDVPVKHYDMKLFQQHFRVPIEKLAYKLVAEKFVIDEYLKYLEPKPTGFLTGLDRLSSQATPRAVYDALGLDAVYDDQIHLPTAWHVVACLRGLVYSLGFFVRADFPAFDDIESWSRSSIEALRLARTNARCLAPSVGRERPPHLEHFSIREAHALLSATAREEDSDSAAEEEEDDDDEANEGEQEDDDEDADEADSNYEDDDDGEDETSFDNTKYWARALSKVGNISDDSSDDDYQEPGH